MHMQFDSLKTTRFFVKSPQVLSNSWHLTCCNFCYILRKIPKLYFLEASHWSLKTSQKSCSYDHSLRRNNRFEEFVLFGAFYFQNKNSPISISKLQFSITQMFPLLFIIFEYLTYISQLLLGRRACYFSSLDIADNNVITDKRKQQ